MIWVRFGFMTGVKVTDIDREYQFGSNGGTSDCEMLRRCGAAEAVPGRKARHEILVRSVRAAVDRKKRIPCCAAG